MRRYAAAITVALVGGMLSVQGGTVAQAAPVAAANCAPVSQSPTPTAATRPPANYTPRDSTVTWNNPLGNRRAKRVNTDLLLRTINSVPTCQTIQIATWNFRSAETARALRAAMNRGVQVRILMSAGNDGAPRTDTFNPTWRDFSTFVNQTNARIRTANAADGIPRPLHQANTCARACRSAGGAAHSKYYMFSRAGSASNVVLYGSHNATDVAATNQWNDLVTVVRPRFYSFMNAIFDQSLPKRNQARPFREVTDGNVHMDVYALNPGMADPMMRTLNNVRCAKAGKVGVNGRTALRISVSAILNPRGLALAKKVASLKRAGCDVKILTTNVGVQALRVLQNARVPIRQLARFDARQGKYVTYTHTKFMTINGNYGNRPGQQIVWNGTGNWTQTTLEGDELVGEIRSAPMVNVYNRFVNTWFRKAPGGKSVRPTQIETGGRTAGDVWSLVEKDY